MTLSLDVASYSAAFATSHSHAGGSPDGALLITVTDADPTGATYDGTSLVQIGTTQAGNGEHTGTFLSGWLLASGASSGTVTVAVTGVALAATGCYSLNASATGVIEENNDISGTALSRANPSDNLALSSINSFVAMGWGSGHDALGSVSPLTNWSVGVGEDAGTIVLGVFDYDIIGTTDVSCGATQTAEDWCYFAAAVNETIVAGGGRPQGPLNHPFNGPFGGPL